MVWAALQARDKTVGGTQQTPTAHHPFSILRNTLDAPTARAVFCLVAYRATVRLAAMIATGFTAADELLMNPPSSSLASVVESETLTTYAPPAGAALGGESPLAVTTEEDGNADAGFMLQRSIAALLRYKWLVLIVTLAGSAAGYYVKDMFSPTYEAEGKIWISQSGQDQLQREGPVRGAVLLPSNSWGDLLVSYAVVGRTVRELHLFVHPTDPRHNALFASADETDSVRAGAYMLRVDSTGTTYTLASVRDRKETVIERGTVGDSVGRGIGLRWKPDANALLRFGTIGFSLTTARQASLALRGAVRSEVPREGNIMRVYVTGAEPWRTATIANSLLRHLVETADDFKRGNLTAVRKALDLQLTYAGAALQAADSSLERFRMQTITLPSEEGTPINGGVAVARNPAITNYFDLRLKRETTAQERAALERTLNDVQAGKLDVQAFWQVIPTDAGNQEIGTLLAEYTKKQSDLRTQLVAFTEEYEGVKETRAALGQLKDHAIPALVSTLITQLKRREDDLSQQIANESSSLQAIPPRTIEEVRLTRGVDARTQLFSMLQRRFEEARLAELSVEPDLSILDMAGTPEFPISNRGRQVFVVAVLASIAAAVGGALLLDRFDKRIRFIQDVPRRLRYHVLGAVPHASRRRPADQLNVAQIVESFRSIRLNSTYAAAPDRCFMLTVTSAGASEGKSFVSANLALAFAESGYRTLLIDGDVRRGSLHVTFDTDRCPGLVEILHGSAHLADTIRATSHPKLSVIPSGARVATAPELLTSEGFVQLTETVRESYDVVLIDSAPLAAGMDAHAICIATTNVLFVVRMAQTDGAYARQKLDVLERFPVRVLGAVVNDVRSSVGLNDDYSYLPYYGSVEEEGPSQTTPGAVRVLST
jgi:capsular exopolysaccharide synthesis family protein